jgi:hypothetical protein
MYTDTQNRYITALFDLVETVYYPSLVDGDANGITSRHDKKRIKKKVKEAYDRCYDLINHIRDLKNTLTWQEMWEFAEFIKTIEKVYFYQNVQKSSVCCDNFSNQKRDLFFDYTDKKMYIKITMEAAYTADDGAHEKLNIGVYRDYGKKEKTTFYVDNGKTDIDSDSDVMLIHTINAYVQKRIADLFECYVELAYNKLIYESTVGPIE